MNPGPYIKECTLTGRTDLCIHYNQCGDYEAQVCKHGVEIPISFGTLKETLKSECWAHSWRMKNNQVNFGEVNEKRKGFWRGERAHAKAQRSENVMGSWSKTKSKAIPGGSGCPWMSWTECWLVLLKEREERNIVLWLLNRSMLPPDFKTCFHMCLILYWEGSIVLSSPGNAHSQNITWHSILLQQAGWLKLYFVL